MRCCSRCRPSPFRSAAPSSRPPPPVAQRFPVPRTHLEHSEKHLLSIPSFGDARKSPRGQLGRHYLATHLISWSWDLREVSSVPRRSRSSVGSAEQDTHSPVPCTRVDGLEGETSLSQTSDPPVHGLRVENSPERLTNRFDLESRE